MFDLYSIKDPSFIKTLSIKELKILASEIRSFLVEHVSKTGGHLSSNLGIVEITLAMYYVFDYEKCDFIFDVGHQSYVHKILTGRAKEFDTLRQYGGLSGYISKEESKYDIWESGHSSTSISAACGMMVADKNKRPIVVIGDSSISNGVAFEGLNFLGQYKSMNAIIILNDNKMGISKSVGSLTKSFLKLRSIKLVRKSKSFMQKVFPNFLVSFGHQVKRSIKGFVQQDNIFEDLGFDYYGPYYGNRIDTLVKLFKRLEEQKEPVIAHCLTKKGLGYEPAVKDVLGTYHGVPPFDVATGKPLNKKEGYISYSEGVSRYLLNKREKEEFYVITPAMKSGAHLDEFSVKYPDSIYDVGIAEEHAAVMSAGIATVGKNVVLLMYSTFAQRAYDEFLNDIARSNLKVIIGIDRSGIVGEDGVTHQGIYDLAMFMEMPNIVVTMPKDMQELIGLFNYAFIQDKPIVIRYPKLSVKEEIFDYDYVSNLNWDILNEGKRKIVIGYGDDISRISNLVKENKLDVEVVNAKSIKPIDEAKLHELFKKNIDIIVVEQNVSSGTLYHKILEFKEENNYKSKVIKHAFNSEVKITHGKMNDVYSHYGFSSDDLIELLK